MNKLEQARTQIDAIDREMAKLYEARLDAVKDVINNMPTAYDVDKVVEQLKDEQELSYADFEIYAEEHGLSEDDDWHHRGLGRAVEIVKRGGTDGKID